MAWYMSIKTPKMMKTICLQVNHHLVVYFYKLWINDSCSQKVVSSHFDQIINYIKRFISLIVTVCTEIRKCKYCHSQLNNYTHYLETFLQKLYSYFHNFHH